MWALLGLGDALAAETAHGIDALVSAALVVNAALMAGAALALANARSWKVVVIAAMVAVTVHRIVYVWGTGDYLFAISSIIMLAAIIAIATVARSA